MADLSANTANHTTMSELIKVHYHDAIPHLVKNQSEFLSHVRDASPGEFDIDAGGRQIEFPYPTKRGANVGVRGIDDFEPGFSGATNDTVDVTEAETAVVNLARIYSTTPFDGRWLAKPNKKHMFDGQYQFSKHLKEASEDMSRELQLYLLSDSTGIAGIVNGTPVEGGGNTTVTLQSAQTYSAHGRLGTQAFEPNKLYRVIRAADWAVSQTASQADSTPVIFKVVSTSDIHDHGTTPQVTFLGTSLTIADGDILVPYKSRSETAGGSSSGATLNGFEGLLNFIDDGTHNDSLYGLSRSSFPVLKSQTNLSTTLRPLTHQMVQVMLTKAYIKCGTKEKKKFMLCSHPTVRDQYVPAEGEQAKRYQQAGKKALDLVSGFSDVEMVFLGNQGMVPWVCDRDFGYGHAFIMRHDDMRALWDKRPGIADNDGLSLRKVNGKDQWYVSMSAYGQFIKKESMYDGRLDALQGAF